MSRSHSLFETAHSEDMQFVDGDSELDRSGSASVVDHSVAEEEPVNTVLDEQADTLDSLPFDAAHACIQAGILSEVQVESLRRGRGGDPAYDLIRDVAEKNVASQELLAAALSQETGFEWIRHPDFAQIPAQTLHGGSFEQLLERGVLPYRQTGNLLQVAIADENGLAHLQQNESDEELHVTPIIVTLRDLDGGFEQLKARESRLMKGKNAAEFSGDVIKFVDLLLHASISDGASDIHIEPFAKRMDIRRRIDGVMLRWPVSQFLAEHYVAIVARIKILSALNISEHRLPQDGAMTVEHDGNDVDIRVSIIPALFGERVVMRILNKETLDMNIDNLGFGQRELALLKDAVDSPQGMVLVTGPTGSGKSTTLYSVLNRINQPELNILTAEDPVEYHMDGVGQIQIKEEIGLTFASILRSFLRQDPDVILVGEIRDKETVDIAIKAALTGHLVLSTLHTNDAPSTISRLLNIGVPDYMISTSLRLVVAQRLVRVLCEQCKEEDHSVLPEELVKIGFEQEEVADIRVLKGRGCPACHDTGYKGRRGLYEVLPVTDKIRTAIDQHRTTDELREVARQEGFQTIQDVARVLIARGELSIAEYGRVVLSE